MNKVLSFFIVIMLSFSLSFSELFSFFKSFSAELHSFLSLTSTLLPGDLFSSYTNLDYSVKTEDGYYVFDGLDQTLSLPNGRNWFDNAVYSSQTVQDWLDLYVLPYSSTSPVVPLGFGLEYYGYEGWEEAEVTSWSLYPTVYSAKLNSFFSSVNDGVFLEGPSEDLIYFIRLSISFSTPSDRPVYVENLFNRVKWYRRLLLNDTKASFDFLIPISGNYRLIRDEGALLYSGAAVWLIRSFGDDILLSSNSYVNSFLSNDYSLTGVSDTGVGIVEFLRDYPSYGGGRRGGR